ncbi:MAG: endonuclease/exonuclease/phosphatase family protein [Rhizomicrobium sp.]
MAAPIALWFLGWILVGDDLLPVRWGAYAAPWLALLAAAAALLFAAARTWPAALAILIVGLLILAPVAKRFDPARWGRTAAAGELRVMSFNVSTMNSDFPSVARLIARERPDVIFLQQLVDLPRLDAELARLPAVPKFAGFPAHGADMMILSRFPIGAGRLYQDSATAIVTVGGCPLRLWSFHAPHGQNGVAAQSRFFSEAAASVADEPLPVIAGGDLNSTEFNSVQAPLRAVLRDANDDAGAGLGFTFPSRVRRFGMLGTLFRIDYIFSRGVTAVAAWTVDDNAGSDHFPVMAAFRITDACRRKSGR